MCCGNLPITVPNYAQGTPGNGCVDKAVPGRPSDCPKNKNLCDVDIWRDLMTNQCPRTCGRCGQAASFTPSSTTTTIASSQGGLPVATSSAFCSDKAVPGRPSDCPGMTHLCNEALYYDMMTSQCPLTCGRCGVGTNFQPSVAPRSSSRTTTSTLPRMYQNANVPDYSTTTDRFIPGCVDNIGPSGKSDCPGMK